MRNTITEVTCDRCYAEVEINRTTEEGIDSALRELGWRVDEDEDICPACQQQEELEGEG